MRWLTLDDDPTAGGTNLDALEGAGMAGVIPLPAITDAIVPTTAQVDPGSRQLARDNDVAGTRANSKPVSFAAAPTMTFGSRAWTGLSKRLLRKAMGGAATPTGAAPAPITTNVGMLQEGNLPGLIATLVREGQVDQVTGLWLNELTFNFPADEEGTIEATLMGLYHEVNDVADVPGLPAPSGHPDGQRTAFMLRDIVALMGDGAGVPIDCLGGFGFTLNNNLSDDFRTRFCAGQNVLNTTVDGELKRLWYPDRNKLGPQAVTGRLDFGDVRPDRELRRILGASEKLVVELYGDPLGTTPEADEAIRLIFWNQAPTGGGAEPLQRDGDQQSSYEFTAYVEDATGKDLETEFVGSAALA